MRIYESLVRFYDIFINQTGENLENLGYQVGT